MKSVQILQEIAGSGSQHFQNLIITRILAKIEESFAEQFQNVIGRNFFKKKKTFHSVIGLTAIQFDTH